jgi:hypothetical protein
MAPASTMAPTMAATSSGRVRRGGSEPGSITSVLGRADAGPWFVGRPGRVGVGLRLCFCQIVMQ